jgi:hypothetical protein
MSQTCTIYIKPLKRTKGKTIGSQTIGAQVVMPKEYQLIYKMWNRKSKIKLIQIDKMVNCTNKKLK